MSKTQKERREMSPARRAAETALDVALGGTALAADKALETVDRIVSRGEDTVEKGRREARRVVSNARHAIDGHDSRAYEERTRDELYALAAEREIEGRSKMRKDELIAALRAERS